MCQRNSSSLFRAKDLHANVHNYQRYYSSISVQCVWYTNGAFLCGREPDNNSLRINVLVAPMRFTNFAFTPAPSDPLAPPKPAVSNICGAGEWPNPALAVEDTRVDHPTVWTRAGWRIHWKKENGSMPVSIIIWWEITETDALLARKRSSLRMAIAFVNRSPM